MGKKLILLFWSGLLALLVSGGAMAQHQHDHGGGSMKAPKKSAVPEAGKRPVQSQTVEGFKITFEIMDMTAHMQHLKTSKGHGESAHSQSHTFMVAIQDTASKEIISDAKVRYTIISPAGEKETGELKWSGDHYGGGFSPKEKGTYRVQLRVESGGMEREATFSYQIK